MQNIIKPLNGASDTVGPETFPSKTQLESEPLRVTYFQNIQWQSSKAIIKLDQLQSAPPHEIPTHPWSTNTPTYKLMLFYFPKIQFRFEWTATTCNRTEMMRTITVKTPIPGATQQQGNKSTAQTGSSACAPPCAHPVYCTRADNTLHAANKSSNLKMTHRYERQQILLKIPSLITIY